MSQKIESFIRYLNYGYPVFYHCVGYDQVGELQGVPRDEPELHPLFKLSSFVSLCRL
jgi:hypothetical protein